MRRILQKRFGRLSLLILFGLFSHLPHGRAGGVVTWGDLAAPPSPQPNNVVALAGGLFFSLALESDGTVFGWGSDTAGQTDPPAGLNGVEKISASYYHGMALQSDGTVAAWGLDNGGESNVPAGLSNVVDIAAGGVGFSLALKSDGTVSAWGDNTWGECNVPGDLTNAVALAAGYTCSLAILSDGTVTGWGDNEYGQLNIPADLTNAVSIAAAERHVAVLKSDGTVVAWGDNTWGQCNVPAGLNHVTNLVAGGLLSLALTSDGQVVAWGNAGGGSLPAGINSVTAVGAGVWFGEAVVDLDRAAPIFQLEPVGASVYLGDSTNLQAVVIGAVPLSYQWYFQDAMVPDATNSTLSFSNLTAAQSGDYFLVASNDFGSLTSIGVQLTVADSKPIISSQPMSQGIYPGGTATFQVTANGNKPLAYQWSLNGTPILNATNNTLLVTNATTADLGTYFVAISNPAGSVVSANATLGFLNVITWGQTNNYGLAAIPIDLTNAIALAAGSSHCVALRSNGRVVVWGSNSQGQTNVPASATNVTAVAAAMTHTLALRANGTVVTWGTGAVPVPAGLSGIVAIATGDYHSMALKSNGSVVVWANGSSNSLTSVPPNATNVVAIAAGGSFCVALLANGTVVTWGSTFALPNITNAVAIAAGELPIVVLKADGRVYATNMTPAPASLSNVVAVAAGSNFALALKNDGTVTNWVSGAPVTPTGLTNVSVVASSQYFCLAIVGDGPQPVPFPNPPLSRGTNSFALSVPALNGHVYWLEYKTSLTDTNWTPLPLNAGNGGFLNLNDPNATNSQRLYQIREW
jgi:alpha-tubulin suppressor-like RCC1 family protein